MIKTTEILKEIETKDFTAKLKINTTQKFADVIIYNETGLVTNIVVNYKQSDQLADIFANVYWELKDLEDKNESRN